MNLVYPLAFLLVISTAACDGDAYRSPTQPEVPSPQPASTWSNWKGTSVVVEVTGPAHCALASQELGEVSERHFLIERTESTVSFMTVYGPDAAYDGTIEGREFTAHAPVGGVTFDDACVETTYGGLSGQFSQDGKSLVATEFWAWPLRDGSGEIRWVFELELEYER